MTRTTGSKLLNSVKEYGTNKKFAFFNMAERRTRTRRVIPFYCEVRVTGKAGRKSVKPFCKKASSLVLLWDALSSVGRGFVLRSGFVNGTVWLSGRVVRCMSERARTGRDQ